MVCFYLYVRPALLKMGGRQRPRAAASRGAMRGRYQDGEGPDRVRARAPRARGRRIYATPTGNQGSGILSSLSRADALLIGPAKENLFKAGTKATVLLLDPHAATDEDAFFEAR